MTDGLEKKSNSTRQSLVKTKLDHPKSSDMMFKSSESQDARTLEACIDDDFHNMLVFSEPFI